LTPLLAIFTDIAVDQDPQQPRLNVGIPPEGMKTRVRLHHGFLYQVLRVRMIPAHPKRMAVHDVTQRYGLIRKPRTQLGLNRTSLSRSAGSCHCRIRLGGSHYRAFVCESHRTGRLSAYASIVIRTDAGGDVFSDNTSQRAVLP
jgi:hypothetical protein